MMAERRMFTKKITESDAFLEMPASAQNLYFHLNMDADDDGFVNAPKKIMKIVGASNDDMGLLVMKRFVLVFDNGVIVIKHWRMHNLLRHDRYHPTQYQDEFGSLTLDDENIYHMANCEQQIPWQPNVNQMATEVRIGKESIGKEKNIRGKFTPPTLEEVRKYCEERGNGVDYQKFYEYYSIANWKDSKGNPVRNWKQKMIANWEKEKPQKADIPKYEKTNKLTEEEMSELLKLRGE